MAEIGFAMTLRSLLLSALFVQANQPESPAGMISPRLNLANHSRVLEPLASGKAAGEGVEPGPRGGSALGLPGS